MKLAAFRPDHPLRLAGAGVVGLVWSASFPLLDAAGAAWLTPAFLLAIAWRLDGGAAFRVGFVAGLVHALSSLYWLLYMPFPPGAVLGWVALSAYLALFPALWVWLCWRQLPLPPNPGLVAPALSSVLQTQSRPAFATARASHSGGKQSWPWETAPRFPSLDPIMTLAWPQRLGWTLSCAALWVGLEMFRGWFLGGFPWNYLGVSQHEVLPLAQLASVTGVPGISFLVVWFSLAMTAAMMAIARAPTRRMTWMGELALPLVVLVGVMFWGARQMVLPRPARGGVNAVLVQPSIPQTLIWNPDENTNRFRKLIELSELAVATRPDLLVWPEAAVPNLLRYDPYNYAAITNLVRKGHTWMVLGADDAEPSRSDPEKGDFYNSSFLIGPDGSIRGQYRKQHLVPFGEFIPLARWFPFLKRLIPVGDGFQPGDGPVIFRMDAPAATASVLICFEDVLPALARRAAAEGPDFLLNLTNNGWFGESANQWQHAANASFRAIENRLPLVRCANNGLTCWVDAIGRKHAVYFDEAQNIYAPGFKSVRIPLIAPQARERTPYQAWGDWFGWGCFTVAATLGALNLIGRRKGAVRR